MGAPDRKPPSFCVVIPAYDPDDKLVGLVDQLRGTGLERTSAEGERSHPLPVVVVDDGSEGCEEVFSQVEARDIPVIHFEHNRGKGAALKEGLSWAARRGFSHAVTADSDGQHTRQAILDVARCAQDNPGFLVLGVRDVRKMPRRSRLGNTLTRALFAMLYNVRLSDTQTGLRGIPLTHIDSLVALVGDRYEYEMNMLVHAGELFDGILEVPISTVYFENNSGSHFNAIRDGARVYRVLFGSMPRFLIVSLASFALDYSLFSGFYLAAGLSTVAATLSARAISATFNYLMNRHWAFRNPGSHYTVARYLALSVAIVSANSLLMHLLVDVMGGPALVMKVFVECFLYLVSFTVQNNLALGRHEAK